MYFSITKFQNCILWNSIKFSPIFPVQTSFRIAEGACQRQYDASISFWYLGQIGECNQEVKLTSLKRNTLIFVAGSKTTKRGISTTRGMLWAFPVVWLDIDLHKWRVSHSYHFSSPLHTLVKSYLKLMNILMIVLSLSGDIKQDKINYSLGKTYPDWHISWQSLHLRYLSGVKLKMKWH